MKLICGAQSNVSNIQFFSKHPAIILKAKQLLYDDTPQTPRCMKVVSVMIVSRIFIPHTWETDPQVNLYITLKFIQSLKIHFLFVYIQYLENLACRANKKK